MNYLEIKLKSGLGTGNLYLGVEMEQLDSLRFTSYLIYLLSKYLPNSDFEELKRNLRDNLTYIGITSPFFESNNNFYLPANYGTYTFFEEDFDRKKMKKFVKFNIKFDSKDKFDLSDGLESYEILSYRIKNEVRGGGKAKNVYTISTYLVKEFKFLIFSNWSKWDLIKSTIFKEGSIHFIGKRISIGFGRLKIEHDNKFKINDIIVDGKIEKGYYYIFNRIPINETILKMIDVSKSHYEIVKIFGYLPKKDSDLVGRVLYCFKEGSILYFNDSELKNLIYDMSSSVHKKDYFVPVRPVLIKIKGEDDRNV